MFRFPRREQALDGVRREIAVLPWLAPRLPLAIPVPELVGTANDWPFWGSRLVPGTEIVGLPEADRTPLATAVGQFLRALCDADPPGDLRAVLPTDPMRRANPPSAALARRAGSPSWTGRSCRTSRFSTETAMRARVLAASLCAALASYAAAEGDRPLFDESVQGLGRCIAD